MHCFHTGNSWFDQSFLMDAPLYNIYSILSDIYMLILHKISVF